MKNLLIFLLVFSFGQISVSFGKGKPDLYGNGYKLKFEAHLALQNMQKEAQKSDLSIKIVSSYRSFKHQNEIWERKYEKYISQGMTPRAAINKIIEYVNRKY